MLDITHWTEIDQNAFIGPVSTALKMVAQRDGDLYTYFDVIDESEAAINETSIKQILISNPTEAYKELITRQLPLDFFGSCRSFKKFTKGLGFELD